MLLTATILPNVAGTDRCWDAPMSAVRVAVEFAVMFGQLLLDQVECFTEFRLRTVIITQSTASAAPMSPVVQLVSSWAQSSLGQSDSHLSPSPRQESTIGAHSPVH